MSDLVGPTVGALAGAWTSNQASRRAADEQKRSTAEAARQFDVTQQNFTPYKNIGESAAPEYQQFVSGNTDIANDPLYKNQMKEATRQATQRAAGSGQSSTGGAVQTRLAQLADQIYNSTYQTKYKELTDALKVGQGAAGSIADAGQNFSNAVQQGANNLGTIETNRANTMSGLYGRLAGNTSASAQNGWETFSQYANKNNWWQDTSGSSGESTAPVTSME